MTSVQRRTPLNFFTDDVHVWVTYLDEGENTPHGFRVKWLDDGVPFDYLTDDGGYSYKKFGTSIRLDGTMEMCLGELESDPENLNRLHKIWVAYQQKLGETVFSV